MKKEETQTKKENKEKAYVILLAGQSNAAGLSGIQYLRDNVTEKEYQKYMSGYENIKINYYVDGSNVSYDFVPVKLGQGQSEQLFGPEVGIAETLSEKYPDRKFYIIKAAISGSGITTHWQEGQASYNQVITAITQAFGQLSAKGLEPEWFATCWMQGETDAYYEHMAETYYRDEVDLINRLKERYAKYISPKSLSFIDGEISEAKVWEFSDKVNNDKKKYASESESNYYMRTRNKGITFNKDNDDEAHYDALGMLKLGRLFGERLSEIIEKIDL